MTKLSVNVNKLATLRNSREKNLPDVVKMSRKILGYGAHGLTVHPRPDGRHIRAADVENLSALVAEWNSNHPRVEFNIEGYPTPEFLEMLKRIHPDQCTLVPDPPTALTSDAGWDFADAREFLLAVVNEMKAAKIRVSLFADPRTLTEAQKDALLQIRPDRIELYTEAYADHFGGADQAAMTQVFRRAAEFARQNGIGVNAGHDLNQENLGELVKAIPWLSEVSIGHALICEALEQGLETTVGNYLRLLKGP